MNPQSLPVLRWFFTFASMFTAGAVGFMLPSAGAHPTLPLLTGGIAVAACVRWGRQMWPAVLVAGMGIDLWMHQGPGASLFVGLGAAGGAVSTAWILERRGFDRNFGRARDVPLFILAAAIGTMIVPTLGLLGFRIAGDMAAIDVFRWLRWWSNTTAGVLLVGPILVAMSRQSLAQIAEHWAEGGLWLLAVAICCAGTFWLSAGGVARPLIVMFALVLVVVGTMRFGLVVASFGPLAVSAVSGLSFAFGQGVFAHLDEFAGLATIWSFSAALTGVNLIITALLAERDHAADLRLRAEHRYAQIFDGSPQPLWVHDPRTLEFLLVNEAAVSQYGWSREEFLALRVPALATPGGARVLPMPPEDGVDEAPEPFETRHQTRDGRVLAVEVWTRDIDLGSQQAELVFASDVTERRALGSALIDAIANEQRRVGQELHDGLGQELTGLALSARALATRAEREFQPIATGLLQLAALAGSCIQAARRIAQGVSPLSDADGRLQDALESLAGRSSFGNTLVLFRPRLECQITLDLDARNHLYRIAQEAVQNALKHAGAGIIEIELWVHARGVRLTISDDGVGLSRPGIPSGGFGMRTMKYRASSIGGRLVVARRSSGGVSIICEVAQQQAQAA